MSEIKLLDENHENFPNVELAMSEPNGLLAVGGDLNQERLIQAYQTGIFPWYEEDQPILWWSPDPRCVVYPEKLHISRSLKKTLRRKTFSLSSDRCFEQVMDGCAGERSNNEGTWITPEIRTAYCNLHRTGLAHSVEVWQDNELVGGLYGIAMGSVFFGESMFSKKRDASKVALSHLVEKITPLGFTLIDCQVYNPHLESLGAECIPRGEFTAHLQQQIKNPLVSLWR